MLPNAHLDRLAAPSEARLQQSIANLLLRMPDVTKVQILQGQRETGKDIIFYARGGFGEPMLCACVVKNKRITGSAEKSPGARTVFHQAEQAFDTPYVDENGLEVPVQRVYIITPFALPPETIDSIKGRLSSRQGQVVFVHGPQLVDLFKVYWPDYVADESRALQQHVRSVTDSLTGEKTLQALAFQYQVAGIDRTIKSVYVKPDFNRVLYAYRLGDQWSDGAPSSGDLEEWWTAQDIKAVGAELNRISTVVTQMAEWNYITLQVATETASAINLFTEALDNSWDATLEAESIMGRSSSDTGRVSHRQGGKGQDATAITRKFTDVSKLRPKLEALRMQVENVVAQFEPELTLAKMAVCQGTLITNADVLADVNFLRLSKLRDFVESSAEDLFSAIPPSMEQGFSYNLLQKWDGHLLIVGAAGYGKTSFCRWHALQDIEAFNSGQSKAFPVYIPLYQFSQQLDSPRGDLLHHLVSSPLLPDLSEVLKERSNLILRIYMDGLDEIPHADRRREVIELARLTASREPGVQIVVTARDYILASWLAWLPKVRLRDFSDQQVSELANKWLDQAHAEEFFRQVSQIPALKILMGVPLLATLILLVFRQTSKLPENRTRLYEMFVDLLAGGWDLAKGVHRGSKYGVVMKTAVLRRLAFSVHKERKRAFEADDVRRSILELYTSNVVGDWRNVLQELLEDGLIVKTGTDYAFSHMSFQEFLCARDLIGDPQGDRVNTVLRDLLIGDVWWKEVVLSYIGISAKPRELTMWLEKIRSGVLRSTESQILEDIRVAIANSCPGRVN